MQFARTILTARKAILIGGTSHLGKSTLGLRLSNELGWRYSSTDRMARHPGRPWSTQTHTVPAQVASHYLDHDVDTLVASVLNHYHENVWPIAQAQIRAHLDHPMAIGLVLEGSALCPELVPFHPQIMAVWLTGSSDLIRSRILAGSHYDSRNPREQQLISSFIKRSVRFNESIVAAAEQAGHEVLDVTRPD